METLPNWIVILILVVLAGIISWWKFRNEILLRFMGEETQGVITNWMSTKEKGKRYYYPLIEFTTKEGQRISYRAGEHCEGEPMYPQGTIVQIKYLRSDPKNVKTIYPG